MSYIGNSPSGSNTPGYPNEGPSGGHSASLSLGNQAGFGDSGPSSFGSPQGDDSPLPTKREGQVRRGVCKFFNSQKGFGFVLDNNAEELGGQEIFVHFTAIQSRTGFRSLAEGEEVEYEITTGPKGFQATRLTGPGGRPVVGDPKARLMGNDRKQPQFMQLAPIAFPSPYGMDPYIQQHPGAVYAASPYTSHVLYVPSNMHPGGQGQYAPMGGQAQYSPQMQGGGFNGNPRGGYQGQQGQPALQSGPGGFGSPQGSFGPVGGIASTMGGYGGQQQSSYGAAPASTFGGGAGNGSGPGSRYSAALSGNGGGAGAGPASQLGGGYGRGAGGNPQDDYGSYGGGGGQGDSQQSDQQPGPPASGAGSSSFFGSGNLLYSSK